MGEDPGINITLDMGWNPAQCFLAIAQLSCQLYLVPGTLGCCIAFHSDDKDKGQ